MIFIDLNIVKILTYFLFDPDLDWNKITFVSKAEDLKINESLEI